jgi:shikimate dehydrogenase
MDAFLELFDNREVLEAMAARGRRWVGIVGPAPSVGAVAQTAAWNRLLDALVPDAVYLPLDLKDAGPEKLAAALKAAQAEPRLAGFKVAPPYKEPFYELLNERAEPSAAPLRAANTVYRGRDGKLRCANTDGEGMRQNLLQAFGVADGRRILLLGAGGAAASIGFALGQRARKVWIANRTRAKAQVLAQSIGAEALSIAGVGVALAQAELVINTTSVGRQGPLEGFSALASTSGTPEENAAASKALIDSLQGRVDFASTLYVPEKELLLRQAETAGHRVVNGLGMWLFQAAIAAKELFFSAELAKVPLAEVAKRLREGLEAHQRGAANAG